MSCRSSLHVPCRGENTRSKCPFKFDHNKHMDALFVDPDVRGCGVGKLLIEHALSLTPKLTTNVNEQNEQAVGFYQKMGFRVTGRSETDDLGQPYPLLNLMYEQQAEADYD
nr:acetyltransferase [Klebsiella pneumoniae]